MEMINQLEKDLAANVVSPDDIGEKFVNENYKKLKSWKYID